MTLRYTTGVNSSGAPQSIPEDAFNKLSKGEQGKLLGWFVCDKCERWFGSQGLLNKHVCGESNAEQSKLQP